MDQRQNILTILNQTDLNSKSLLAIRKDCLQDGGKGFAAIFIPLAEGIILGWLDTVGKILKHESECVLGFSEETDAVCSLLRACHSISRLDETLSEELARQGLHILLSKIIKIDCSACPLEEGETDGIMEIQDIACEIATLSQNFPVKMSAFTTEELLSRLPLEFDISSCHDNSESESKTLVVFIRQVAERQSSQYDVGFLMWPSAVVLSKWLVANKEVLIGKTVLELGAGCGLVGLVAGTLISQFCHSEVSSLCPDVLLTDFNPVVVKNCSFNVALNGLEARVRADVLDFYQQDVSRNGWLDSSGRTREQVDLILAADVICQASDAIALSKTIRSALRADGLAIVVSASNEHRYGVEKFAEACASVGLRIVKEVDVSGFDGQNHNRDLAKTTGYVEDMTLSMYFIRVRSE